MRNTAMIIMIEVARLSNGSDHKPALKVDARYRWRMPQATTRSKGRES